MSESYWQNKHHWHDDGTQLQARSRFNDNGDQRWLQLIAIIIKCVKYVGSRSLYVHLTWEERCTKRHPVTVVIWVELNRAESLKIITTAVSTYDFVLAHNAVSTLFHRHRHWRMVCVTYIICGYLMVVSKWTTSLSHSWSLNTPRLKFMLCQNGGY